MRLVIDYDLCVGHGMCVTAAPDLITFEQGDQPTLLVEVIASDRERMAQMAVDSCPERALSLED